MSFRGSVVNEGSKVKTPADTFDVVIFGGGLAGQTLARQIVLERPSATILVTELRTYPAKDAAHKVGESTVEIGAHYFAKVLGLEQHLKASQLRKAGLRYFFSRGANTDVAARIEMGASYFPPVPSYQINRGRFENTLIADNIRLGVEFWDRCKAMDVKQDGDIYHTTVERLGETSSIRSRWIVDASGRAGLLKRKFGLKRESPHKCNAVWFRIDDRIDLDDWSEDPTWKARLPKGLRWLSTNHFMGRGYWVWFIPLAGDATSIGIVADSELHPLEEMRSFPLALDWLRRFEPQCAREIEARSEKLLDFLAVKHYAHGCARVFSGERWALTGDAGVFTDPFYSPGSDFIAMSNTFITDLIVRDLGGEDIARRSNEYDRVYLNIYESYVGIYHNQYRVMGNSQVMAMKVVWDFAMYWSFLALRFMNGRLCDLDLSWRSASILQRANQLNCRLQKLFRAWDETDQNDYSATFIDVLEVEIMQRLHTGLSDELPGDLLLERMGENLKLCECLAAAIFRVAEPDIAKRPGQSGLSRFDTAAWLDSHLDHRNDVEIAEIAARTVEQLRQS